MSEQGKRRVLAIDGGGIKGVLPAAFLASIEETTGKRIVDHFDLIAGTSTGGIIALGLGLGIPASEILKLYCDDGPAIFASRRRFRGPLSHLRRAKYDSTPLEAALRATFGDRRLGDSQTRLVIPAFQRSRQAVYVFKTSHHQRLQVDWRERAVDVALATAAAPLYFPSWALPSGISLLDGGIWANNPAGMAAVEAVGLLGWPGDRLFILSLGCTETHQRPIARNAGWWHLLRSGVDLLLSGQTQASHGTAKLLTGHTDEQPRVFRINPAAARGQFALDRVDGITDLRALGSDLAREHCPLLERVFLESPREAFVPFHPSSRGSAASD